MMIDSDVPFPRLMNVNEVMQVTSLSRTTVYELIKVGELTSIKTGGKTAFEEAAVKAWINRKIKEAAQARRIA